MQQRKRIQLVEIKEIRENDRKNSDNHALTRRPKLCDVKYSSEETNRLFIENDNNKESYFERSIDCLHKQVKDTIKEMTRKRYNTE